MKLLVVTVVMVLVGGVLGQIANEVPSWKKAAKRKKGNTEQQPIVITIR
jgi:hypothetical protein